MAQSAAADRPEVRISFIGPALYQLLPAALVQFRAAAPQVHARLYEIPSPAQVSGILAGDFDVGFITEGIPHSGCESMQVERSRFVAAVPANSALAERDSVTLAELALQPFIMPPPKFAEHSETMNLFKNVGVVPRVEQRGPSDHHDAELSQRRPRLERGYGDRRPLAHAKRTLPAH